MRAWKERSPRGQEVFTLPEGRVEIEYPENLSGESLQDLGDYINIFLRKMKRRVTPSGGACD